MPPNKLPASKLYPSLLEYPVESLYRWEIQEKNRIGTPIGRKYYVLAPDEKEAKYKARGHFASLHGKELFAIQVGGKKL